MGEVVAADGALETSFPKTTFLQREDVLEFDLRPGDVLYIPPFWLHEVLLMQSSTVVFLTDFLA